MTLLFQLHIFRIENFRNRNFLNQDNHYAFYLNYRLLASSAMADEMSRGLKGKSLSLAEGPVILISLSSSSLCFNWLLNRCFSIFIERSPLTLLPSMPSGS